MGLIADQAAEIDARLTSPPADLASFANARSRRIARGLGSPLQRE
jgi:hypothetical protein